MGSGVVILDANGDGRPDLLFANGPRFAGKALAPPGKALAPPGKALAPPGPGLARDFFFASSDWDQDGDPNVAAGETVLPPPAASSGATRG